MGKQKADPRALALTVFVILLIAGAVGARLWANQQRLEVPNFRAMTSSGDGRVFVVLGNTLYVESASGESLRVLPLAEWGVEDFNGDLAVLSDGSLVLGRGRLGEVGIAEGSRMMLRERPVAWDPVERLQRCALATGECVPLDGDGHPLELRRGFSLAVDEKGGFIYASDAANHRLLQATLAGEVLASHDSGWEFPNGVRVVDANRIALADTNHARYVELAVGPDGFGDIVHQESILGWPGVTVLQRFPFEVLTDGDGALWMLVAGGNMNDATLHRRAANGEVRKLVLPEEADPVALAQSGERVLVADAQHFRIHSFEGDAISPGIFGSSRLREQLDALHAEHDRFALIFDYSLIAVLVVAIPALGVGVFLQVRAQTAEHSEELGEGPASAGVPGAAATADASMLMQNPAAQLASLRGEFVFWRKFSALGTREGLRFGVLVGLFILVMIAGVVWFSMQAAERNGTPLADEFDDPRVYLVVALSLLLFVFYWLSAMYERLIVNRDGIRYVSFLSGPLRFLNGLHPDWSVSWEQVEWIRLKQTGDGRRAYQWRYEIRVPGEGRRKVNPLAWRLAGEHEVGVPLRSATRLSDDVFREAISRTLLYRLLTRRASLKAAA